MQINDFLAISVVGAGLSFLVDWMKVKYGTEGTKTKSLVLALSILVGAFYIALRATPYLETVLTVLGASSVVYAFFLKK